ncbi:bacteriocin [Elizabethkingia anophelis]|uniref:bacteriocin n=1 Tax=Elizabethkingia anophelis TaxID=1117645 RepID=UPI0011169754|nr:bacteriocin [Elizabethkingia anophelis]MCT4013727.1 bacteriocin [Elizabethkingia anophelis]
MKLTELTKKELKTINGGGKLGQWLGEFGPEVLRSLFGYNRREEGDYFVKSPY